MPSIIVVTYSYTWKELENKCHTWAYSLETATTWGWSASLCFSWAISQDSVITYIVLWWDVQIRWFYLAPFPLQEQVMTVRRTWGGPNAPHIKTLTLGKNIVIIPRATGNGPPDTKVVDVHLHGHFYNSLFISIRSRGCHPLTRLQRQKPPKPLSLTLPWVQPGFRKSKAK